MSAGRLPFPGTEFGPCELPCEHKECNETERMSQVPCPFCLVPIGYETRYYNLEGKQLVHAICFEDIIEPLPYIGDYR